MNTLSTGIEADINRAKDQYNGSPANLVPKIQEILIRTSGGDGWKAAWFIADKLDDMDESFDVSIEFTYRAEYGDSMIEMGFNGGLDEFVDKFHFNTKPGGTPDDQYIEGTITLSLEASEDILDELEEAIPNNVAMEMQVQGEIRIEQEAVAA